MKLILVLSVLMSVNVYAQKKDSVKVLRKDRLALKDPKNVVAQDSTGNNIVQLKPTGKFPYRLQINYGNGQKKVLEGRTQEELQKLVDKELL